MSGESHNFVLVDIRTLWANLQLIPINAHVLSILLLSATRPYNIFPLAHSIQHQTTYRNYAYLIYTHQAKCLHSDDAWWSIKYRA